MLSICCRAGTCPRSANRLRDQRAFCRAPKMQRQEDRDFSKTDVESRAARVLTTPLSLGFEQFLHRIFRQTPEAIVV